MRKGIEGQRGRGEQTVRGRRVQCLRPHGELADVS